MSTESHDKIIAALLDYCRWQDRFENKGSDEAGLKARNNLAILRDMAIERRKEIQEKRKLRRKLRNAKNGRPPHITTTADDY